jgi:mono/diheme cytochrome c family protein
MGKFIAGIIFTLVVGIIVALCAAHFGLVNMRADTNIPSYERKLAGGAMDAYVEGHAPKQQNPVPVNDQNLIEGVQLYKQHCAVCHGGPADPISQIGTSFYPHVPQFLRRAPDMPDYQNFFITKYGIRWTGMPGWGKVMSDEQMWKIMAFLSKMDKIDELPAPVLAEWKKVEPGAPAQQMNSGANAAKTSAQGQPNEQHEQEHKH